MASSVEPAAEMQNGAVATYPILVPAFSRGVVVANAHAMLAIRARPIFAARAIRKSTEQKRSDDRMR